ncbi:hypothetical protein [Dethiosulfatarculus sandiegensis]|uniref:Uncharacterized protein n=1 Tax=Dethiosulfatarculus sandiegensis TaxID=1429043 RepID=A0A0D2HRU9_9BACT|nr:hypothetical protein [Dethiosulfatarculus sandiegensis]KIX13293.1 hypothetical protein X474_15060 [Dethiosulfatarculus sandiegensis]
MDTSDSRRLLEELAKQGEEANTTRAAETLGLDRSQAEDLTVALMGEGLLEMVSLSGKVRLTESGRQLLGGQSGLGPEDGLESLVADLASWRAGDMDPVSLHDYTQDLNCLKAQAKRSEPLLPVVTACLKAIQDALSKNPDSTATELSRRIGDFLNTQP